MRLIQSSTVSDYTTREIQAFLNDARRRFKLVRDESNMTKKELIENNLLFVVTVAKKYAHKQVPMEDIVQYGCLGLIEASNRFDPTRGFKFISFAVHYIQQAILIGLNEYLNTIRLPSNIKNGFVKIGAFNSKYFNKFGEYPSGDVIKKAGIVDDRTVDLFLCKAIIFKFENKVQQDSQMTYEDTIEGQALDTSWEEDEYFLFLLERIFKKLTKQERKVMTSLYLDKKSRSDVARELHLTEERIQQVEYNSLRKINKMRSSIK